MFDGESETINVIDRALTKFLGDLTKNSRKYFAEYDRKWTYEEFLSY